MPRLWGPERREAAVSLTFDNLGEASDLEFGRWPVDRPVGRHHSVRRDLPAILAALEPLDIRATFFIEAWNLPVYPDVTATLQARGHEVAAHGMRHEMWGLLTAEQELDHIGRCQQDFARYGVQLQGLRPPGGVPAASSAEVLAGVGLRYISPLATPTGVLDSGLATLRCEYAAMDAAYYSPSFTSRRRYRPGPGTVEPADLVTGILGEIDDAVSAGDYLAVICHPHLQSPTPDKTDPSRIEAIAEIARRLRADDRLWLAPCADVASWMLDHRDEFATTEELRPPDGWDPDAYSQIKRTY